MILNIVVKLTEICKSIEELELIVIVRNNNYGIIKLIETRGLHWPLFYNPARPALEN